MHFEILVEDKSGAEALNILVPKIIGEEHTFKIHSYAGAGHLPKNMNLHSAKTATLLNNLPKFINGYAKSLKGYSAALFIVCDLDDKNLDEFQESLHNILDSCSDKPETRFCIAIEEGESWLLGDISAINQAYTNVKNTVLASYQNDSICGTWEKLADAVYKGGSERLRQKSAYEIGGEKIKWARTICPFMNVDNNLSPSFCNFRDELRQFL